MAAGIVANPMGDVMNPDTGEFWADPRRKVAVDKLPAATPKLNTTIGVIATNAPITKAQAKRLAMVAHDGIARAITPHTHRSTATRSSAFRPATAPASTSKPC